MREWIEVTGKTVDDAVTEALIQLGTVRDNVEVEIIEKESKKEFLVNINAKLSAFEKQVFILMIQGYKYQEISQKLNVSAKSVDNAMQRIKGKVKKL